MFLHASLPPLHHAPTQPSAVTRDAVTFTYDSANRFSQTYPGLSGIHSGFTFEIIHHHHALHSCHSRTRREEDGGRSLIDR